METRNNLLQKSLHVSLLVLLGVFVLLSSFKKQRWDTDIFWALRTGEWIATHMSVPETDPFSFTFHGREWIDFTWGFQLIAHIFYTYLGGWWGLFVLQCIITGTTFILLYLLLRTIAEDRHWLVTGLLYVTFVIAVNRFFIRPHLFGYLFIVTYFYIFTLSERGRAGRAIFFLPLLQVLWTNIHSSFVLGIFMAGVWALGSWIDNMREEGALTPPPPQTWLYGGITVLLFGASFINPYGWKLVFFPFIHQMGENAEALRHIQEWQAIPLKKFLFEFYPSPPGWLFVKILWVMALVAMFVSRSVKTRDVIFFAVATYMAVKHIRWIALFPFFTAPLVASNITGYTERRLTRAGLFKLTMVALIPLSLGLILHGVLTSRDHGIGIKPGKFPEGTVSFIKTMKLDGNIFNDYVFGGYLIYNDIKVFIDGRTPTLYSPLFFWKSRVVKTQERWDRLVDEYSLTMALIKRGDGMCKRLLSHEDWIPVMIDDVSALFLKRDSFPEIIEHWELKHTPPCYRPGGYELPQEEEKLKAIDEELQRIRAFYASTGLDRRFYSLHRLTGLVYMRMEDGLTRAREELEMALQIKGRDPYIEYDLGLVELELGELERAEKLFLKAGSFPEALLGLGRTYHRMKRHDEALRILERYMKTRGDHTEPDAYWLAGKSCFELGDTTCTVKYLKMAEFVLTEPRKLAETYYYLGSTYLELNDQKMATLYYSKAIQTKEDYKKGLLELVEIFKRKNLHQRAKNLEKILSTLIDKN